MRKRGNGKLPDEVRELVEDLFVDGLTQAINEERITIDDARKAYAKVAHLGFWGLHPRKFTPKITYEDLMELKERLKSKRSSIVSNLDDELKPKGA